MSENTDSRRTEPIMLGSFPHAIVHIDCDAFFASCEQAGDPSLKGRAVVTGKERGIIACASYEAKRLGIKRGVSLRDAKMICPELVVLPNDYETYSLYSERVFEIARRFTPSVEEFSIDEAFCDITGLRRLYRTSYQGIARMIKDAIQKELDITVSAGLSLTKALAKICSRHDKPDGFTVLPGKNIHLFLQGLPLDRVCGFGPNTVALLKKCGLNNVYDYVNKPVNFALEILGKTGYKLWQELRGIPVYDIETGRKDSCLSISKTRTFSPSSSDKYLVRAHLMRNLESAFMKLRRHNLSARKLTVYLRTADFAERGLIGELDRHSPSTLDFTEVCSRLFDTVFETGLLYRATGVILSDLVREGIDSRTLFDDPARLTRIYRLSKAMDSINASYGKYAVHLASTDRALKGETYRMRLNIPLLKNG